MTAPPQHTFNLVTEPWIPVTMSDGPTELNLSDLFTRAHEIQGLNEPSPLTYTALLRFLLAVAHRATRGPDDPQDWAERWRRKRFDAGKFGDYLARYSPRFDLFDDVRPFAQAGPEFGIKDDSPVTRLFMERTSGNNPTLFDHAWDERPPALSPAEAARALLAANAYGFAGAGGKFYNTTLIAGYCLLLEGDNFFQTLMLNMQEYSDDAPDLLSRTRDVPWWELDFPDPPVEKGGNGALGLTDLLTWRGRAIRLVPDDAGLVRRCFYAQRYQLRESEARDPFKRYVEAKSGPSKGQHFPRNFTPGRALWRDSGALLEHQPEYDPENEQPGILRWLAEVSAFLEAEGTSPPTIVATGLVNNQARVDLWRMDRLPLPIEVLTDAGKHLAVHDAVELAETVRRALSDAGKEFATVALSRGERKPDPNDVTRERHALHLEDRYWSRLDTRFQQFLTGLAATPDADDAVLTWAKELRAIARSVYFDATHAAGIGSRWFQAQSSGGRMLERELRKHLPGLVAADEAEQQSHDESVEVPV